MQEIKELAQIEYDQKLKPILEKELKLCEELEAMMGGTNVESVFCKLSKERQELVNPIIMTDEMYIKHWKEKPCMYMKEIDRSKAFKTSNGSYVRSKIEWIIGDRLSSHNKLYKYEYYLDMGKDGIWHPDFTILKLDTREEILWEHYGMIDNPEYARTMLRKRDLYIKHGFIPGKNLIETFEMKDSPLSIDQIDKLIEFHFNK